MRKQCLCVLQPPFFVMRPICLALHPKAGMAFLTPGAPSGLGGGEFSYTGGPQERSILDMVQCLLDNLNGWS
jgi:hypothetical protein